MTFSHAWNEGLVCAMWLICTCDVIHSCMRYESYTNLQMLPSSCNWLEWARDAVWWAIRGAHPTSRWDRWECVLCPEWVMSHICRSHFTHTHVMRQHTVPAWPAVEIDENVYCVLHSCERVMSHIWSSHVIESCHAYTCDEAHAVPARPAVEMGENVYFVLHECEWVMSHVKRSRVNIWTSQELKINGNV